MKDRFGHEVSVGCTVAYPGCAGSSCWLRTGVVIDILPGVADGRHPQTRLKIDGGTWGGTGGKVWNGRDKDPTPKPPPGRRTINWHEDVIVLVA